MKQIFIILAFTVFSLNSVNFACGQNLQEARSYSSKKVMSDTPQLPFGTLKGKPASKDFIMDNIDSVTYLSADIIVKKYQIKERYWWKNDSNFRDYTSDIDSLLDVYNNRIDSKVDTLNSDIYLATKYEGYYNLYQLLNTKVKPLNDSVQRTFNEYKKIMKEVFMSGTTTKEQLQTLEEKLKKKKIKLDNQFISLKKAVDDFQVNGNDLEKRLSKIKEKEKDNDNGFSAIPTFASALGQVTPSITLLGHSNFNNSRYFAEVKAFTGSTELKSRMENLFIPEASKWGISLNFSRKFSLSPSYDIKGTTKTINENKTEAKRVFAVNFGINYLGKDLLYVLEKDKNKVDSIRFNPSVFHFKLGLQHIIIKDFLSVYANKNVVWITENYGQIKKVFDKNDGLIGFIDAGMKCYVALTKQKNIALMLDLDFIFTNDTIKSYTNSEDRIIPNIKISLRSDFGF